MSTRTQRRYRFERDEDGAVVRMVWLGDWVVERHTVTCLACPKCGSDRMTQNRCLACWHDATHETITERRL